MDWSQHYYASLLGMLCTMIMGTSGHGRLVDPPSRVSAWRYGCSACAQQTVYSVLDTDHGWNCGGGRKHQWEILKGACGVCGDPADGLLPSEAGGLYATGTIVRAYTKGSTIKVKVDIIASHLGYIEFKLCPVNNMYVKATQECLDRYQLQRADGEGITTDITTEGVYTVEVVLPPDLTCTQCVMQWHYWAGNDWGDCGDGTGAKGCGPQEVFRACSDVSISNDGDPTNCYPPCVQNKGICSNGQCQCEQGFSGYDCSIKDSTDCNPPCVQNQGICNNGHCQCEHGFSGNDCSTKDSTVITPPPPSVMGCSIFKKSHSWKDTIMGDLTLTFPTTTSSWYLELVFSEPLSNFQVFTMKINRSAGSSFTLTPFHWNSKQETGHNLLVEIIITYSGSQVPQITSAKLSGHELC